MLRLAVLSVHTCPLARLGGWETGGMNVYIRELSRHLGAAQVQVEVLTRRQEPLIEDIVELGPNARVVHLSAGPPRHVDKNQVSAHLPEFLENLCRYQAQRGVGYDLVHSHYWLSASVAAAMRERWRIPVVSMFHTLGQLKNQVAYKGLERETAARIETERRAMLEADRIIATTTADKWSMVKLYGAPSQRISVVPGGVDTETFCPRPRSEARRKLGITEDKVVLYVGRIQRVKGIDLLLHAMHALLQEETEPVRLLIVGGRRRSRSDPEGREMVRLMALAGKLGISPWVTFVGAVEHDILPWYYSAADVTAVPSEYESFGLVALESMACGTPVVASRVSGLQTTVEEWRTGFLIPWRDPHLFAARVRLLLSSPDLRSEMGTKGKVMAAKHAWPHVAQRMLEIYHSVLARHRAQDVLAGASVCS